MRIWIPAGAFALTAAVFVSIAVSTNSDAPRRDAVHPGVPRIGLVSYPSCADMADGLRAHTATSVGPWGISSPYAYAAGGSQALGAQAAEGAAPATPTPTHSTTNDYEAGADEPDIVKTDGNRVVIVSRGVLRVVDTATRKVTGTVSLTDRNGAWGSANLLVHGDRALVMLPAGNIVPNAGPSLRPQLLATTRYVLVDISGQPRVLGTLSPSGQYVDARMIGSTVRLVVRSQPQIAFPQSSGSEVQRTARNRSAVMRAPVSAWLPRYDVTDPNGATSSRAVPCQRVSHPADFTGTSMLTVYSIELTAGLGDTSPISLAADGDTVYATTTSLYVTSNPRSYYAIPVPAGPIAPATPTATPQKEQTEIHRFDISAPGAPRYVASGKVDGRLLNQYSLSDFDGYLRVATTTGDAVAPEDSPGATSTSSSSVYVLRSDTLVEVGRVGGLGRGQRIYSVRFIGPVGYVVTFRQMDPLYTLDLSDPAAPRVAGQLEITGYSSYLHPAGSDRLIGVGQEASTQGRPTGLQVSLFDVSDPARPQRLAHLVKTDFASGAEWDPHAFLYWPQTGAAVLPVNAWQSGGPASGALVLKITGSGIAVRGDLAQPATASTPYQPQISRALVIGSTLWTLSDAGLMVTDTATLSQQAWISAA